MAMTKVADGSNGEITNFPLTHRIVWLSDTVGYVFYIDDGKELVYKKTETGPAGWNAATPVVLANNVWVSWATNLSVLYDQDFNESDTGRLIHVLFMSESTDVCYHRSIDTANSDTLSTLVTVFTPSAAVSGLDSDCSIGKTSNGRLIAYLKPNTTLADCVVYYSDDDGATWTVLPGTLPTIVVNTMTQTTVLPWTHWDGTTEDFVLITWQGVNDDGIYAWVFDWSTSTWTEQLIFSDTLNQTCHPATIRRSDDHIWVLDTGWSNPNYTLSLWEIYGTGQDNITTAQSAEATALNNSYTFMYSPQLTWVEKDDLFYVFLPYDSTGSGSAYNCDVAYYEYEPVGDTWDEEHVTLFDNDGTYYIQDMMGSPVIGEARGGYLDPIFWSDHSQATGGQAWYDDPATAIQIEGTGNGAGTGGPLDVVDVLNVLTVT